MKKQLKLTKRVLTKTLVLSSLSTLLALTTGHAREEQTLGAMDEVPSGSVSCPLLAGGGPTVENGRYSVPASDRRASQSRSTAGAATTRR
jgi:hypothetical protein